MFKQRSVSEVSWRDRRHFARKVQRLKARHASPLEPHTSKAFKLVSSHIISSLIDLEGKKHEIFHKEENICECETCLVLEKRDEESIEWVTVGLTGKNIIDALEDTVDQLPRDNIFCGSELELVLRNQDGPFVPGVYDSTHCVCSGCQERQKLLRPPRRLPRNFGILA